MKRYIFFIFVVTLFTITKAQIAFQAGEELEFAIKYGPITGGIATVNLYDTIIDGKKYMHAKMIAQSTGIADLIYRVKDIYETTFDPHTGLPVKSMRNINEGDYHKNEVTVFYHKEKYVITEKNEKIEVPDGTIDMVTALYKIRRINYSDFNDGDIIDITTYFDNEIFPFDIRYRGIETIKTGIGKIECIKFVPFVEPGRIFETEDDMTIWVTNDKNLLPVRVKFDLLIGSIKCDLTNYKNLKFPVESIKN